jgi:hypothetical protein
MESIMDIASSDFNESMTKEWLKFDIEKVKALKEDYEGLLEVLKKDIDNVNLNSRMSIIQFFKKKGLTLKTSQIKEIEGILQSLQPDTELYDTVQTIVSFMKVKYTVRNYLSCILKNEVDGVVTLRDYYGLKLPNRQPLPYALEIVNTILDGSEGAMAIINDNNKLSLLSRRTQ